jgi:hypothetical protein
VEDWRVQMEDRRRIGGFEWGSMWRMGGSRSIIGRFGRRIGGFRWMVGGGFRWNIGGFRWIEGSGCRIGGLRRKLEGLVVD